MQILGVVRSCWFCGALDDVAGNRYGRTPNLNLLTESFLDWQLPGQPIDLENERIGLVKHLKLSVIAAHDMHHSQVVCRSNCWFLWRDSTIGELRVSKTATRPSSTMLQNLRTDEIGRFPAANRALPRQRSHLNQVGSRSDVAKTAYLPQPQAPRLKPHASSLNSTAPRSTSIPPAPPSSRRTSDSQSPSSCGCA